MSRCRRRTWCWWTVSRCWPTTRAHGAAGGRRASHGERSAASKSTLLAVYAQSNAHWIVVSNEVGLGIVPAYRLGRVYARHRWGGRTSNWPAHADTVLFMVASCRWW
ncbi:MAG: bifunctional adenosylcobinamide kinase/adenosylcobinamide-phosphate guanylyltransferase [Caldilineaceae bacterium]